MIKIEHVVTSSPDQMAFVIEGMRNPLNSWNKSDSVFECDRKFIGSSDLTLMKKLASCGSDDRKFMRQIPVFVRITAPLYWWKEFDTYKVGTVSNSCSTMHKIADKEFTIDDFSTEHLLSDTIEINKEDRFYLGSSTRLIQYTIDILNYYRNSYIHCPNEFPDEKKRYWWQLIQLLPSSYNQTRNVSLNYEVLKNIYNARKEHKLDEWKEFCEWIKTLPESELITE